MDNNAALKIKKPYSLLNTIDRINEWAGSICAVLLAFLAIISFYGVISRYVFSSPSYYAWDINIQLFAFILMLSGGYTLLHEGHVSVDVITTALSSKHAALLKMFNSVFCFVSAITLIWFGTILGWESFQIGERMSASMWEPLFWPVKMMVPIGGVLLGLQGIAQFVKDYHTFRNRKVK